MVLSWVKTTDHGHGGERSAFRPGIGKQEQEQGFTVHLLCTTIICHVLEHLIGFTKMFIRVFP